MIKLKDLGGRVKIIVEKEDYKQFLTQLKNEGFLWQSGEIIKPECDEYHEPYHSTAVLTSDGFVYHPSSFMSFMALQNADKYYYKEIKEAEVSAPEFIVSKRTLTFDGDYKAIFNAKEVKYKNRCKRNRKINEIQLKNKDKTRTLQKSFFVQHKTDDELVRLVELLENHGYENIHDIDIDNLATGTRVLIIDNEHMTFSPAPITICACAKSANKKFYTVDKFEKIIIDIFDK